jgi:hypothetical protein
MVKIFVTLDVARPRGTFQHSTGLRLGIRYQSFDIGKCDWFIRVQKVGDQEARPGIARTGIRNDKRIIGINRQVAARNVFAECVFEDVLDAVERSFSPSVFSC